MDFFQTSIDVLASWKPVTALVGAFVFGLLLAWVYEVTYQGLSYSRSFNQTIVLACLSASIVAMTMEFSMVAGIGLLGVLSMVRFRTTLKSARDLVFIMGAATVGVACGVGAILAAFFGSVAFVLVTLYLHIGAIGSRERFDGVLRFRVPSAVETEPGLSRIFSKHVRDHVMLSVGEAPGGALVEHAYQVKFWRKADQAGLLASLRDDVAASDVVILLQESGIEY